jgi:hypothetical protein
MEFAARRKRAPATCTAIESEVGKRESDDTKEGEGNGKGKKAHEIHSIVFYMWINGRHMDIKQIEKEHKKWDDT